MSILVKGMDMPKSCSKCLLEQRYDHRRVYHMCPLMYWVYTDTVRDTERHPMCPLVEVPEKMQKVMNERK